MKSLLVLVASTRLLHTAWALTSSAASSVISASTASAKPTCTLPSLADAAKNNGAGQYADKFNQGAGGGANCGGHSTAFVPVDGATPPNLAAARFLMGRQDAQDPQYLYQMSPNLVDAAAMRGFTGSVVQTLDTQDAALGGSPQVFLSHGERDSTFMSANTRRSLQGRSLCTNDTSPIHLFSGLGNNVTVLTADIPYDGGILHITSGFFSLPQSLSGSLSLTPEASTFGSYLSSSNSSLDITPSITVFAPSNAAIIAALASNKTLSAAEVSSLVGAHVVSGYAAYSPFLISGATFKTVSGPSITIGTGSDGSVLINGASKIVKADIVITNGVLHIIDKVLYTPPSLTTPSPSAAPLFTGAAGWSPYNTKSVGYLGTIMWSLFVATVVTLGGVMSLGM